MRWILEFDFLLTILCTKHFNKAIAKVSGDPRIYVEDVIVVGANIYLFSNRILFALLYFNLDKLVILRAKKL